jgi:biopolymer transport protein ExbB
MSKAPACWPKASRSARVLEPIFKMANAVADLVEQGGLFVYLIFLAGVVLWTLVFERYWYFERVLSKEVKVAVARWQQRQDHVSWCARQIRKATISRLNGSMSSSFPLMQVLVPLSPLLGLIGTVSGMLEVFDSMALRGSADARTMASGVSHAMICTMTGLAISITGLYPVHYFRTRTKRETELIADKLTI